MVKALLAECEGEIPKGRKGRRRHRAISTSPVILPTDHLPSSTRGPSFSKGNYYWMTYFLTSSIIYFNELCVICSAVLNNWFKIYLPVTKMKETENRGSVLLGVVLAILIFLVFLNGLLYYKLWLLEDFTQVSKYNFWQADVDVLRDPPKSHEEWLKVLRLQENIHNMEVDKWQKVLQSAVDLLKKVEESLSGLQKTIKSPYEVLKKDKQEL